MQKNKAGQKTWYKPLYLLQKFTDELSVSREYVKKSSHYIKANKQKYMLNR